MKNIFCFVFLLTFALVLGRQDVQKKMIASCITNTDRALESLEEVGLGTFETWTTERDRGLVGPPVSKGCENDMNANKIVKAEMGIRYIRYKFQTTCYLIGNANLVLFMKSKTEKVPPGGKQCAENAAFQAVFLPLEYNANTYMSLNPATAPWFFTAPLTGCDIFVATNPDQPNQPIVIHSNLQKYQEHNLVNLQFKGMYAEELLDDSAHAGYQLIARVYHKPSPGEEVDVKNYLEKYEKKHKQIKLLSYTLEPPATPQVFHFFGHYDMQKMQWNFLLKGEKDGVTTSFAVSGKGNVVAVGGKNL